MEEMVKETKDNIFKKLHASRRGQIIVCITSMLILLLSYPFLYEKVLKVQVSELLETEDSDFLFDGITCMIEDDNLVISGAAYRINSKVKKIHVVLEAQDDSELIIPVHRVQSDNLERSILEADDLNAYTFNTSIPIRKLNDSMCYKMCLSLLYESETGEEHGQNKMGKIFTGKYLFDDEVYEYNPLSFHHPIFANQEMQEVVNKGDLLLHNDENGIWIYIHEKTIYWIVDSNFDFDSQKSTYIPCHIYTVSNTLNSQGSGETHVNCDFYFERNEIALGGDASYRVSKCALPEETISWIRTGVYSVETKSWYWYEFIPVMN